jgi:protein-L-isoaspartate(D-aspartate) O-methyltransferase
MRKVPRHLFVEEALQQRAYGDYALPIGEKQTISQPYMVALMTEALSLNGSEKVLELGTGSGYQTAVLAEVSARVFSIERIKGLAHKARKILESLQYLNVVVRLKDGTYGWKEEAPFDVILVAAGAPEIPSLLIEQLKIGGRLVIPIGGRASQVLKRIVREEEGIVEEELSPCVFVPLVGAYAWKKNDVTY